MSFSAFGAVRLGFPIPVLDPLHLGLALFVRSFTKSGLSALLLDGCRLDSAMFLRSVAHLSFSFSAFSAGQPGSLPLVLDFALAGSTLLLRSSVWLELPSLALEAAKFDSPISSQSFA